MTDNLTTFCNDRKGCSNGYFVFIGHLYQFHLSWTMTFTVIEMTEKHNVMIDFPFGMESRMTEKDSTMTEKDSTMTVFIL